MAQLGAVDSPVANAALKGGLIEAGYSVDGPYKGEPGKGPFPKAPRAYSYFVFTRPDGTRFPVVGQQISKNRRAMDPKTRQWIFSMPSRPPAVQLPAQIAPYLPASMRAAGRPARRTPWWVPWAVAGATLIGLGFFFWNRRRAKLEAEEG